MTDVITENTRAIVRIIKLIKLASLILFLIMAVFVVLDVLIITGKQAEMTRDDINDYKDDPSLPETGGIAITEFVPSADIAYELWAINPANGIVFDKINDTWAAKNYANWVELDKDDTPDNYFNVSLDVLEDIYYGIITVQVDASVFGTGIPKLLSVSLRLNDTEICDEYIINATINDQIIGEITLDGYYNFTTGMNFSLYMDCKDSVASQAVTFKIYTVSVKVTGMVSEIVYVNTTVITEIEEEVKKKVYVYLDPTLEAVLEAYGVYIGMILAGLGIGIAKLWKSKDKKKPSKLSTILGRIF